MARKPLAGPAKAALNLVHDQRRAFLFRQLTSRPIEVFGNGPNPALALNGLDQDGTDVIRQLAFEIFGIIEFHEVESGNQRFELLTILLLSSCRQRAERPPVKRLIE